MADTEAAQPANYVDIKLHGITNLPANWTNDSGAAPLYNDHPFRYEVELAVAGQTQSFSGGRILQNVGMYSDFITNAKLPPPQAALDDEECGEDPSDVPANATAPQPPREDDQPVAAPASTDGVESSKDAPQAPAQQQPNTASAPPVSLLWVLGPEHDTDLKEELAAKAKDAKSAPKKGQPAPVAVQPETIKPIAPNTNAPPPCCLRFPLTMQQLTKFEEQVENQLPLTMTFKRILRGSCPPEWEDTMESKFQASINVSLKALSEPGSLFLSLDVPLEPTQAEQPKEDDKSKAKKAPPKKAKGGTAPAILTDDWDASEPHPYVASKTQAHVTITCHSAITRLPENRPRPDLQPSDLIPKRVKPPRRPVEATKMFSKEIEGLIARIVRDYREHQENVGGSMNAEDSRMAFLQSLSTSGKTHVYRELLMPSVQGIVKETFIRKPSPSAEEMDRVANELYTYLLDHLHITMNRSVKSAKAEDTAAATAAAMESDAVERYRRLAMEAEVMQEYATASKYHQERLVKCREMAGTVNADGTASGARDDLPDVWCEYAEYNLRVRDALKAEQGYREALSLDLAHLPSLIGIGALQLTRHQFHEANVFLQSAVDIDGNALTWGMIALYHDTFFLSLPDSPEEESRRTGARRESKYSMNQAIRAAQTNQDDESREEMTVESVYEMLAKHLLGLHQEELVNICLSKAKPSQSVDQLYAKLFYQTHQYEEAVNILQGLCASQPQNGEVRLLLGDVYVAMQKQTEAEQQYDQALRIDPHCGTGPSYVRLGNMYVSLGKYKDALSAFLMGAKVWPCGLTWLGVGISYYRMDDLVRAEQALNESNILNNRNAKTWAYLALVCLRQRREDDGDQAFNQAIKAELADPYLIAEIGSEQARLSRWKIAEACFKRSLSIHDDCNTRMHLARALASMRQLAEAREEFAIVARTTTNETQRARAEEQLQQIPASE